ncbi:MAG: cell division protein SepF [Acidimicrobiales bacterium]
MAVFRNVMAFLGLDDDDQMYDDEAYYDEEEEQPRRGSNKTIALDDRLSEDQTSFGFSADSEMNEMGGVGAVRPLRPIPSETGPIPEALGGAKEASVVDGLERRTTEPQTTGAFGSTALEEHAPSPQEAMPPSATPASGAAAFGDAVHAEPAAVNSIDGASQLRSRQSTEEPKSHVVTHAKPRLHIPSSFDDASRIADDFRAGAPVVMNLTKVEKPVARRLVDFASGVCYVLAGGMERVAANVYLLTPAGIDVSADDRRRMQERGFDR